jgi:hypothetical protein
MAIMAELTCALTGAERWIREPKEVLSVDNPVTPADGVFAIMATDDIDEGFMRDLLRRLNPPRQSRLYHPDLQRA